MAADWRDKFLNLVWPQMGLRRYGLYLLKRIPRLSATPHAIGAGLAAGAAVSMFPLIGLHILLGMGLAYATRGNLAAAVIGTAWGNPLTFPAFFSASYEIGEHLLGRITPDDRAGLAALGHQTIFGGLDGLWPTFQAMMVGAIPLAITVYVVFYLVGRTLISRYRAMRADRLRR